jgi:hypothetical protein
MKKIFPFLLLLILLASCKSSWNDEDKDAFYQACTDEAIHWAGTQERAKTYCDCVFGKMIKKYPNEEDALEHIDSLGKDPDLIRCKEEMSPQ